ncbi:hypothetical protein BDZ89DRAFT_1042455 [Hymenopellis radicata]|nr:hypothetical protein BDZ89DRAFT_1042455 [Hymenopellis radicata]
MMDQRVGQGLKWPKVVPESYQAQSHVQATSSRRSKQRTRTMATDVHIHVSFYVHKTNELHPFSRTRNTRPRRGRIVGSSQRLGIYRSIPIGPVLSIRGSMVEFTYQLGGSCSDLDGGPEGCPPCLQPESESQYRDPNNLHCPPRKRPAPMTLLRRQRKEEPRFEQSGMTPGVNINNITLLPLDGWRRPLEAPKTSRAELGHTLGHALGHELTLWSTWTHSTKLVKR